MRVHYFSSATNSGELSYSKSLGGVPETQTVPPSIFDIGLSQRLLQLKPRNTPNQPYFCTADT
jgi:hypothetical protein